MKINMAGRKACSGPRSKHWVDQTRCRLLNLPRELRDLIYDYTFVDESFDISRWFKASSLPGLLYTCPQIYYEASPSFFANITFVTPYFSSPAHRFLSDIGPDNLKRIGGIHYKTSSRWYSSSMWWYPNRTGLRSNMAHEAKESAMYCNKLLQSLRCYGLPAHKITFTVSVHVGGEFFEISGKTCKWFKEVSRRLQNFPNRQPGDSDEQSEAIFWETYWKRLEVSPGDLKESSDVFN